MWIAVYSRPRDGAREWTTSRSCTTAAAVSCFWAPVSPCNLPEAMKGGAGRESSSLQSLCINKEYEESHLKHTNYWLDKLWKSRIKTKMVLKIMSVYTHLHNSCRVYVKVAALKAQYSSV